MTKLSDYSDEEILQSLIEDEQNDEVLQHVKSHSNKESGLGYLARGAARTAKDLGVGLTTGITDLATLPARLASPISFPSLSELSHKGINKLTSGYTEPKTRGEKFLSAATEGIGSMPTMGVAGRGLQGVKGLSRLGKFLETGTAATGANLAATGLSSGVATDLADQGYGLGTTLPAAMLAGALPGTAKSVASGIKHPIQSIAKALKINPEKFEAFEKSKLIPTLADVSDSSALKSYQNMISELPFHGKIKEIQKKLPEGVKEIIGYEKGREKVDAGSDLLKAAEELREKRSTESGLKREAYEDKMPDTTIIPGALGNKEFKGHLVEVSDVLKPFQDFEWGKKGVYIPEKARNFYRNLQGKVDKVTTDYNVGKGNWIKYNDLQDILEGINSKTEGHLKEISKKDLGALKHMAGSIKKSVEQNIEHLSPQAHKQFMKFKKHWATHADEEIPNINKILEADEASGKTAVFNKVYNDLFAGDGKIAKTAIKGASGNQVRQFSHDIMREMANNGADELSAVKFATRYKKLKSRQKDIAFSGLSKQERNQLDDVVKVIDSAKDTLEHANKSRTSYIKIIQEYAAKPFAAGVALLSGKVWPLETAAALLAAQTFTKYGLTDQKNIKLLAEAAKIKNPNQLLVYMRKLEDMKVPGMASLKDAYSKQLKLDKKNGIKRKFIPLGTKAAFSTEGKMQDEQSLEPSDSLENYTDEEILQSLQEE